MKTPARPHSLRARLVATVLVLLAVRCRSSGWRRRWRCASSSTAAWTARWPRRTAGSSRPGRGQLVPPGGFRYGSPPPDFLGPGQGPRTVGATIARRRRAARRGQQPRRQGRRPCPPWTTPPSSRCRSTGARTTVDLAIGDYRMVATETAGTVYVIGLPAGGAPGRARAPRRRRGHRDRRSRCSVAGSPAPCWCAASCGRWSGWPTRRPRSARCRWTAARSTWPSGCRDVDPRTEVGQVGERVEPDARPRRGRAGGAPGQRDAGAPVRRRRQPRAAHPARRDPRLRRADPPRPRSRPRSRTRSPGSRRRPSG